MVVPFVVEGMVRAGVAWRIGQIPLHRPRIAAWSRGGVRSVGPMDEADPGEPAALLEREREVERIRAALRAVGRLDGGTVVVEGPAGIGKSRLLEEARQRASALGVRVFSARATELEQGFPFGIVRQLFERPLREADPSERERWLAGPAALGAEVLIGTPRAPIDPAGGAPSGDSGYASQHGLYWLASNVSADAPPMLGVDAPQGVGGRPAVVRWAVAQGAWVHPPPAGGAAARARPRHPAARPDAEPRGGDAC